MSIKMQKKITLKKFLHRESFQKKSRVLFNPKWAKLKFLVSKNQKSLLINKWNSIRTEVTINSQVKPKTSKN